MEPTNWKGPPFLLFHSLQSSCLIDFLVVPPNTCIPLFNCSHLVGRAPREASNHCLLFWVAICPSENWVLLILGRKKGMVVEVGSSQRKMREGKRYEQKGIDLL